MFFAPSWCVTTPMSPQFGVHKFTLRVASHPAPLTLGEQTGHHTGTGTRHTEVTTLFYPRGGDPQQLNEAETTANPRWCTARWLHSEVAFPAHARGAHSTGGGDAGWFRRYEMLTHTQTRENRDSDHTHARSEQREMVPTRTTVQRELNAGNMLPAGRPIRFMLCATEWQRCAGRPAWGNALSNCRVVRFARWAIRMLACRRGRNVTEFSDSYNRNVVVGVCVYVD